MSSDLPSDQKRKIAADCWMKGNQALAKANFDYAIEMYGKAVALAPDNLSFRQSLRGSEYKKYQDNKTGAKLASVRLAGTRNSLRKLRGKQEWAAMDSVAEEGLILNPWDAGLNAAVGEACRNRGFLEVADFSYQRGRQ